MDIAHRVKMGIGDKVVIMHAAMPATLNHANRTTAIVTNAKMGIGETGARCHVIQGVIIHAARQLVIALAKMDTMGICA